MEVNQLPTVFWQKDESDGFQPSLTSDLGVDVLVIGGGFTGLSAARFLKKARTDLSIVVMEKEHCGYGASGRNTGYLTTLIGHDIDSLVNRLGEVNAREVAQYAREAVDHVVNLIESYNIDCDLEKTGLLYAAMTPSQIKKANKLKKAADKLGYDTELWNEEECSRRIGGSPIIKGAFYEKHGGIFNPYKYIRGVLHKVVLPLGVQVYENTSISDIQIISNEEVRAIANNKYKIKAKYVVIATNAYTSTLGLFKTHYAPLHVYTVVSEPLTQTQLEQLKWKGREGVYSLHHILYAIRLTKDNRIAIATGNVRYYWNNQLHVADKPEEYQKLLDSIYWIFPSLKGLKVSYKWEGVIGMTLSDFPSVGRDNKHPNVFYSIAYCGHGVALSNYSGKMITDLFLGETEKYKSFPFVNSTPFPPVPGEPLRKLIALCYIGILRLLDAYQNLYTESNSKLQLFQFCSLTILILVIAFLVDNLIN